MKLLVKQFVKFSIVGGANTAVDFGLYIGLTRGFSWWEEHFLIANLLAFSVAVGNSYILNKFWTFRDSDKRVFRQGMIFMVISLIGLGINQTFVWGGALFLGSDLIGKISAAGATVIWNFSANRMWTFGSVRKKPTEINKSDIS